MRDSVRKFSATRRCVSIALSFLFLIFLVAAQPHRVHHFFESLNLANSNAIVAEDDCEQQHSQNLPGQTHCVLQSAAQNSHMGQLQPLEIPLTESTSETTNAKSTQHIQFFTFSQFLRRAPPVDVLFS